MKAIELFAGAGGLALGIASAGFAHEFILERDKDCCRTLEANRAAGFQPVASWPIDVNGVDVRECEFSNISNSIDLVAAGPPCQPFSLAGKHRGVKDDRNLFPEVARCLRVLSPKAFIIENVRGILRPAFATSLDYILLMLRHPMLSPKPDERWECHFQRLIEYHAKRNRKGPSYNLEFSFLNATDFGVPQRRERVFIVGFRDDLEVEWAFPKPTHSFDSLLRSMWITGEYWNRHKIARRRRPEPPAKYATRIDRIKAWGDKLSDQPWQTVRDAIHDLPDPTSKDHSKRWANHWSNPGARVYHGHTGSRLDEPAKVLKAGAHGVPGGENMLVMDDGSVRYFTVRECARLQTFPDTYVFEGPWCRCMRQLGNAVPVKLATAVASEVYRKLDKLRGPVIRVAKNTSLARYSHA